MRQQTSFEMKLGAGFFATILAAITICIIAFYGINETVRSSHVVIADYAQDLILAGRLGAEEESRVAAARGYLITKDKAYLDKMKREREKYLENLDLLKKSNASFDHDKLILEIKAADEDYERALSYFIKKKSTRIRFRNLSSEFETRLQPKREILQAAVNNYIVYAAGQLAKERTKLSDSNKSIFHMVLAVSLIALGLAVGMALTITRTLSKLHRDLQRSAKMRKEIVEMVAHDLRNPISAINLSAQLLQKMMGANEIMNPVELRRPTDNIKRATDRVNNLISSLLDISKIKAGTLSMEMTSVSPKDIMEVTFQLFENIANEKGVGLEIQMGTLPFVQCDFERIVQVFSNLIGNAIKYSVSGQKIIFGAYPKSGEIIFFVKDEGPGIPAEEQNYVFDRYWQTGNQKRTGIGLGLAICKGIVESHKGQIWLESKLGQGTSFYFSISTNHLIEHPHAAQVKNLTEA